MNTFAKIIYKLTTFLKRIDIIPQITIIYSTTLTILFMTMGKIIVNYTPLIRICIQIGFLLFSAHFGYFTIEDICDSYNDSINQESEKALHEVTRKIVDEMYLPHLKNENLDRVRQEFIESHFCTNSNVMKDYKTITPSDFYSSKNLLLAITTATFIIYFFK